MWQNGRGRTMDMLVVIEQLEVAFEKLIQALVSHIHLFDLLMRCNLHDVTPALQRVSRSSVLQNRPVAFRSVRRDT